MRRTSSYSILLAICFTTVLDSRTLSQSPSTPAFEVASIRLAVTQAAGGEGSTRPLIESTADGLTMENIDLSEMIEWAYNLQHYQLNGPDRLDGKRYDVRARAEGRATDDTIRLMLQNLLSTRFKVQLHHEQKSTNVYELVMAKGGPKLGRNKADALPPAYPKESLPSVVDGGFVFSNVSIHDFAQQLSELRSIDLPVVDRTGISGVYDLTLKSAAAAMLDPNGPSLFTLIEEQLGLKLVSAKDTMDVVVVDRAENPSAN
jgi:uncharacterized protein (TIGR03435 family)